MSSTTSSESESQPPPNPVLLFLPSKEWSPRFGPECFTIEIVDYTSTPADDEVDENKSSIWSSAFYKLLAKSPVYYQLKISVGRSPAIVKWKRYSQIQALRTYLIKQYSPTTIEPPSLDPSDPPPPIPHPQFPPTTFLFPRFDVAFLDDRKEGLSDYVNATLGGAWVDSVTHCSGKIGEGGGKVCGDLVVRSFLGLDNLKL
jgi:hypothetical protein